MWAKEEVKLKKTFDPWGGPHVVMARMSEVRYKLSKVYNPIKAKFLHFDKFETLC